MDPSILLSADTEIVIPFTNQEETILINNNSSTSSQNIENPDNDVILPNHRYNIEDISEVRKFNIYLFN